MVEVRCDECGELMELIDEDSRSEWYEGTYNCNKCFKTKIHRTEFNQLGLVISDTIKRGG